jgi:hypothetical protein
MASQNIFVNRFTCRKLSVCFSHRRNVRHGRQTVNAVVQVHEFVCAGCGILTATLHAGLTHCDECAATAECSECGEVVYKSARAFGDWLQTEPGYYECAACAIADARGVFL